ncbi:MAG: UDP-2,3-diacylglucosamine diphosphatase [Thermodesulfobacteriota bacterium]|nr:UDP-2,3-diacylglucosamine diphosphatase [Thermodesulfobacteriota bacterium]
MRAVFISDAHIKSRKDKGYDYLLRFFDSIRSDTNHLFIVGDFFDFWFCEENNIYPDFRPMVDKILELNEGGIKVSLFEGNHDFFLADFFERHHVKVFPEDTTLFLGGKRIFVSHGDKISASNWSYPLLRKALRSGLFYNFQKAVPAPVMWKISAMASKMSRRHLSKSPEGIADGMRAFSERKFDDGYDAVILGHCHQPLLEEHINDGRMRTFVSLGDWINHFSYLVCDEGEFSLLSYS